MPLFNLEDATPKSVAQFGTALIRLDAVLSMEFTWNHEVNEKSNYAYMVEVIYDSGFSKTYTCSRNHFYKFLMYLDNIGYMDSHYNISSVDAFIEDLHQKHYDLKTFKKITKINHPEEFEGDEGDDECGDVWDE